MLTLEPVPLLETMRELYALPRGWERFERYLATLTGGGDDVVLPPLVIMNPMGKPHVAERVDELLALGAEDALAAAAVEAQQRLSDAEGSFKLGLVVADDAAGGWTNRYLSDMALRFGGRADAALKRCWISVVCWTGETPALERVRQEALAAVYRAVYVCRFGTAATLRQMMRQEGLALAFAGAAAPRLEPEELAYSREVIAEHLSASATPVTFAGLYGDDAATAVGYPALGLPAWAGFAVALGDALGDGISPEAALLEPVWRQP